ncbi:tetratricopeptide repeat protein [Streptomyces sp. NPDC002490]|uniref:tetratricopeptide repeat protein n=1 Tax=Streptomyces sp. NPDC002490 TaxID=3154416 RepID=UPI00332DD80F
MVTGFCDTCHRRPAAPRGRGAPEAPAPRRPRQPPHHPQPSRAAPAPAGGALDRDGLPVLPRLDPPGVSEAADTTARRHTGGRRCGVDNCVGTIGVSYDQDPAPDRGFCPQCGTEYSFRPKLRPGDLVGGHYEVLGYLAVGGHGWIYLAGDTRVPGLHVVLKGLINNGDAAARRAAVEERRSLTTLHHPDIVRIITHVWHRGPGDREDTGYIVMEYVGGRSLAWLRDASAGEVARVLGGPLEFGHLVTYGCMIIGALEYLHDQGLLYCDMKPENVIHYGRRIKVIDLGAVRRLGDRTSTLTYTHGYPPDRKELDERGFHVDSDLFTVARTLSSLAARATPPVGLAARSFDVLIRRATHPDPGARFGSAAEMSRQLWEVLREHLALSGHEAYPERSTRFEPSAVLLGADLGTAPELGHWTRRPPSRLPELPVAAPEPRRAAAALPVPLPDPADEAAALLDGLAADTPDRIVDRARSDPRLATAEAALWLCRAYLSVERTDQAAWWVRTARERSRDYDWRIFWHRGLVHLTRGEVRAAEGEFTAVYHALPGEWAPKLALGYCAEFQEDTGTPGTGPGGPGQRVVTAAEYYEAVRRRDPAQGSAVFGLARIHLRRGERSRARAVLDEVPMTARHYDAARLATVRLLVGRLPDGSGPGAAELTEADRRLEGLTLAEGTRRRLVTELREQAVAARPPAGWGADFPAGDRFGPEDTPAALAAGLFRSLRELADQAGSAAERGALLDRAYAVLPEPWGPRRRRRAARGRDGPAPAPADRGTRAAPEEHDDP